MGNFKSETSAGLWHNYLYLPYSRYFKTYFMKQTYKILIAIALMVNISGYVAAQKVAPPYAIGFRANPDGGGLTAKFFFNENINIQIEVLADYLKFLL
jgi:hypothetical protein